MGFLGALLTFSVGMGLVEAALYHLTGGHGKPDTDQRVRLLQKTDRPGEKVCL
jgi:hypothetical protein